MSDLRSPSRPDWRNSSKQGARAGKVEGRRVASRLPAQRRQRPHCRRPRRARRPSRCPRNGSGWTERRSQRRRPSCLVSAASAGASKPRPPRKRLARRSAARHGDVRSASADLAPQRLLPRRRSRRPPRRRRKRLGRRSAARHGAIRSRFGRFSALSAASCRGAEADSRSQAAKTGAAPQAAKPGAAPVAPAQPAPASTESTPPPAETRKPNAASTASVSNEY